jgi:hypothetical protein
MIHEVANLAAASCGKPISGEHRHDWPPRDPSRLPGDGPSPFCGFFCGYVVRQICVKARVFTLD